MKETVDKIHANFEKAIGEFTRQSGYVEGTLDAIIAIMMDTSPEMSIVSDRLIKTFHSIEGVCQSGIQVEFDKLLKVTRQLLEERESASKKQSLPSLDEAVAFLEKESKKKGGN